MKYLISIALLMASPAFGHAADSAYAGQEHRAIKALSEQEIADYRHGRGMGTSKAAELNRYPGPRHVLDHAQQLGLTREQLGKAREIHEAMARDAVRLGEQIVQKEAELEALYATGRADAQNTAKVVREIGRLQAEYRLVHLDAHLSMRQILSEEQVAAYDKVRGYRESDRSAGGRAHGASHGKSGH